MRFDWQELRDLKEQKLLYIVPHESGKQWILNYAPHAQYEKAWDAHPVLLDCRGTIIDADGTVIARPFRKFFNVGERPETAIDALVGLGEPEIAHKLDGSMITAWRPYPGSAWRFATRGSFTSPQAHAAAAIWRDQYASRCDGLLRDDTTYVFELIGPMNRIVVHYPDDALRLIGLVHTATGAEDSYAAVRYEAERIGLDSVESERGDWADLAAMERSNFEGFVLFWHREQRRVKVKLTEYVRLHRIITGLSAHTIWEILSTGGDTETLRREIPEEMHAWFDGVTRDLHAKVVTHRRAVESVYEHMHGIGLAGADRETRKRAAAYILDRYPDLRQPLFRALDDKAYDSLLWKWIEPSGVPLFKEAE